ncbi:MAG: DUF5719 family protein [Rhodoglobus sp.]
MSRRPSRRSSLPEEPGDGSRDGEHIFPEQDDLGMPPKQPLTARAIAVMGGRAVVGLVGTGVAVLTIVASTVPLPSVQSTAPSRLITPVPTAQQLVCPGAVLRLADETGQDATSASGLGSAIVSSASSAGVVDSSPITISDAGTGGSSSAPIIISTPPDAADPSQRILLSGAQAQQVDVGDVVGLAAAVCGTAVGESWLVGGATTVGRSTLLTLSNPTEVPATVKLELFSENGPLAVPGTSGIIVPASGQRVLSLAGFQPGMVSPVVHMTSTGGQVHAVMQQTILRGLEPGGIEILGSTAAPATTAVIPGVVVPDPGPVQTLRNTSTASEVADDFTTALRLFAPGGGDLVSEVTVTLKPENSALTALSFPYQLDGEVVADIPIQDLVAGAYTVVVDSAIPVVAAVRVTSAREEATDFAWFTAAVPLSSPSPVTIAAGPQAALHLYNPTTKDVTVTRTAQGGSEESIVVTAGDSVSAPVTPGRSYSLTGCDSLYGSVSLATGALVAGYPLHPSGVGAGPIRVYP